MNKHTYKAKLINRIEELLRETQELSDFIHENDTTDPQISHMLTEGYPYEYCISDVSLEVEKWLSTVRDTKIVESEVVVCDSWDRVLWLQKTDGKVTGINMCHGREMVGTQEFKENYAKPDKKMFEFVSGLGEMLFGDGWWMDQEDLNKLISAYFYSREHFTRKKNNE